MCRIPHLLLPGLIVLLLGGSVFAAPAPPAMPWGDVLALDGLTMDTAQMPAGRWRGGGLYARTTFDRLWDDWMQIDPTAQACAWQFMYASGNAGTLVAAATYADGPRAMPSAVFVKSVKTANARNMLEQAIIALHTSQQAPLTHEQRTILHRQLSHLPAFAAQQAALLLQQVPTACAQRAKALAPLGDAAALPTYFTRAVKLADSFTVNDDTKTLINKCDLSTMYAGGITLAHAMDTAAKVPVKRPVSRFAFRWETPLGTILINGGSNDTYPTGHYLLILDCSGDDVYQDGATTSDAAHPVSIIVDQAGNDRYTATEGSAFATGILGYGLLADHAGDDTYESKAGGLGLGIFGVGMLLDQTGNDRYTIREHGEAAGTFGLGILHDQHGDDTYYCYTRAQGYAGPGGCGALVDIAGNDTYTAETKDIAYPSPQNGERNTSLAQGCGFGRRAHPGDGYSLAGGVGVLVDGAGNDRYTAGVFGQGVGYWYALGMLIDCAGDDQYTASWYGQGAAAHYAVAALTDLAGNDQYALELVQGQGHGRDFSTGVLHDIGGTDRFQGGGYALGAANMNGIGVCWKQGGHGDFTANGASLGFAAEARPEDLCLGIFLADGCTATFPEGEQAKAQSQWVRTKSCPLWHGIGVAR